MKKWILIAAVALALAIGLGCGTGVIKCDAPNIIDRISR